MRTKTLLLTAALSAAGVATSMAQVYSVNMVGYVNKAVPAGFSMVANQLNASPDNKVTTLLPAPPADTTVFKFNRTSGGYDSMQFIPGVGWDDGGTGVAATMTLSPGEGAFISAPSAFTATFVGEVQLTSAVQLQPGFSIVSSALPQSLPLTPPTAGAASLSFPAANGDQVYRYNPTSGGYIFDEFITGVGWSGDSNGAPPTPAVGESFFVSIAGTTAKSWSRTFTVGP